MVSKQQLSTRFGKKMRNGTKSLTPPQPHPPPCNVAATSIYTTFCRTRRMFCNGDRCFSSQLGSTWSSPPPSACLPRARFFLPFTFYRPAQFFRYYIFSSPQGTGVQQQDLQDNPFLLHQLRLSKVPCQSRHPIIIYIVIISIISIKYFVISPPCLKLEGAFFFPNQKNLILTCLHQYIYMSSIVILSKYCYCKNKPVYKFTTNFDPCKGLHIPYLTWICISFFLSKSWQNYINIILPPILTPLWSD